MNLRFLTSLLLIVPALLPGQDKGIMPILPGPVYFEVKQYLSLTDAQLQSLQSVLDSRNQAMQSVYTQINQKYEALYQLLNSDSGSAGQLGQFLIDIRNLQKQLPLNDGPYKNQALNVLTDAQKAKLPKLSEALQLQPTAGQAGMLLLIDYPGYGGPPVIMCSAAGAPMACNSAAGAPMPAPAIASRLQLPPANR